MSAAPGKLAAWLHAQARREAATPSLEAALLCAQPSAYLRPRFLRFLTRRGLQALLLVGELLLMRRIFDGGALSYLLPARALAFLIGHFWWGALEEGRVRVREAWEDHDRNGAILIAAHWQGLANLLGAGGTLLSGAWLLWAVTHNYGVLNLFHFYIFTIALRAAVELPVRARYAGVYALRRVFQPLWAAPALEALALGIAWLAWDRLGPWGLIAGVNLIAPLASLAVTAFYTQRAAGQLGLGLRACRPQRKNLGSPARALAFGLSWTLVKIEHLLVASSWGSPRLALFFYVISPWLTGSQTWVLAFQHDFLRLRSEARTVFGRWLRHSLILSAWILPFALALGAWASMWLMFGRPRAGVFAALLVLLIGRSHLAVRQLASFADHDLRHTVVTALATLLTAPMLFSHRAPQWGLALSGLWMLLVAFGWRRSPPPPPRQARLLSFGAWLQAVAGHAGPVRILSLSLARPPGASPVWIRYLAQLEARVPAAGWICRVSEDRLLLAAPREAVDAPLWDLRAVWGRWNALLRDYRDVDAESGIAALQKARHGGAFGPDLTVEKAGERSPAGPLAEFQARFPGGFALSLAEAKSRARLRQFSPHERKRLAHDLVGWLGGHALKPKPFGELRCAFYTAADGTPWAFFYPREATAIPGQPRVESWRVRLRRAELEALIPPT